MQTFLLVDDHAIIRTGLKILIQNEYQNAIVEQAFDANSTLAALEKGEFQYLILDINLPGTNTADLIVEVKSKYPLICILLFSMNPESLFAKRYLKLGVNGFLSKDADDKQIKEAIKSIINKKRYYSPDLMEALSDDLLSNNLDSPFDKLSDREFEIAILMMKGLGITDIAKKLNLHTSTVGTYKSKIFEKCHIQSLIELNNLANMYGLNGKKI
jgi:two-component system invasion response regulator UvrY